MAHLLYQVNSGCCYASLSCTLAPHPGVRFCQLLTQIENPLNEKLPVFRSRDGQEVEYEAGRKVNVMFFFCFQL